MCNFQSQWTTLIFSTQIWPKMNLGFEIQKTNIEIRISILEIPCVPIFRQNEHLELFRPTFAQKWILGSEFKNLSPDLKSVSPRYHVYQCSVRMDNFEFFGLNLGKLPNYVQYFGCNNVERAGWILKRAGWRLKWAGWRWMELRRSGWRLVEMGGARYTV